MVFKRTYRSGNVTWGYAFDAPGSTKQNRLQITASGFGTKKEAGDAEAARRVEVREEYERRRVQGLENEVELPKTLGSLLDRFFTEHGKKRLSAKALERYREEAARLHPELIGSPLKEVTATRLSREWLRLLESGGRTRKDKTPRPLSAKSVRNVAGVVSSAFTRGIEWGMVDVNPVEHSQPPKVRRKAKPILTMDQTRLLIDAASSPWGLSAILELDAGTGLRRGEALALRWSDVDLPNGYVFVVQSLSQTKGGVLEFKETKNGNVNKLALPPSAVRVLVDHRARQEKFRAQFGPDYKADLDLVFCNLDGSPLRPDSVSSKVSALFAKLKLPKGASLHSLRHSHGSHLLAAGVSLADVSKRLGHSNVFVTATVYSHAIAGNDDEAARKWEESFQRCQPEARKV